MVSSWKDNKKSTLENMYRKEIANCAISLGPLREAPKAEYDNGTDMAELANDPLKKRRLNEWLERLGTGHALDLVPGKDGVGLSLVIIDTRSSTKRPVSISETGFGFSQVLPIVMACAEREPMCILIEQPELHIHPRLQAELGSIFVDAYRENGHQIIAETHSEHLMLRVQRLIRTGALKPEEVCVLYVSRHESGSSVQQLRLDADGEFMDEWPGGFFEESFNEMFGDAKC